MKQIILPSCVLLTLLGCNSTLLAGSSDNNSNVSIINNVEDCVAFASQNIEKTSNGIVLHSKAEFKKSTANCGCTSLLLSYNVSEKISIEGEEIEYERLYAQKIAPSTNVNDYPFVISADPELNYRGKVTLKVNCKSPD
ncbi:MAG: hypothetical protein AMJ53_06025 [Gammaproteobacteria bacterium SG8_11]|nr:MAG: hypothetical protein AMJ53_06025 [Gammaproteobacteria bacterium SG8_11]